MPGVLVCVDGGFGGGVGVGVGVGALLAVAAGASGVGVGEGFVFAGDGVVAWPVVLCGALGEEYLSVSVCG